MRERLIKKLSLLFSVYSPLYPVDAILLRINRNPYSYGMGLAFALLLVFFLFGRETELFILAFLLTYVVLHNVWTSLVKRQAVYESLTVYLIHPWLRRHIERLLGYRLSGEQIYEIHIDPSLTRRIDNPVQAGLLVSHEAKQLTKWLQEQDTEVSVIGTTYVPRLAETATVAAKRNLRTTVRRPGHCPIGSKILYPNKSWDTFVWEIGQ